VVEIAGHHQKNGIPGNFGGGGLNKLPDKDRVSDVTARIFIHINRPAYAFFLSMLPKYKEPPNQFDWRLFTINVTFFSKILQTFFIHESVG
jgi:hypothetical protein